MGILAGQYAFPCREELGAVNLAEVAAILLFIVGLAVVGCASGEIRLLALDKEVDRCISPNAVGISIIAGPHVKELAILGIVGLIRSAKKLSHVPTLLKLGLDPAVLGIFVKKLIDIILVLVSPAREHIRPSYHHRNFKTADLGIGSEASISIATH